MDPPEPLQKGHRIVIRSFEFLYRTLTMLRTLIIGCLLATLVSHTVEEETPTNIKIQLWGPETSRRQCPTWPSPVFEDLAYTACIPRTKGTATLDIPLNGLRSLCIECEAIGGIRYVSGTRHAAYEWYVGTPPKTWNDNRYREGWDSVFIVTGRKVNWKLTPLARAYQKEVLDLIKNTTHLQMKVNMCTCYRSKQC